MAEVGLEVWAAMGVVVGTELKAQLVGAARVAAWGMEPGISLLGSLQEAGRGPKKDKTEQTL